jgi:hypothetical protein
MRTRLTDLMPGRWPLFFPGLPLVGIFKAAGSGPEVQRFQEEINSGEVIDFTKVEDVNTVSSLLKTFLRRYAHAPPHHRTRTHNARH